MQSHTCTAISSAGLTIVENIAIATGPAFRGPCGPLCAIVQFVLQYMQGWTLELRCPRKTLEKEALYFIHAIQSFIRWNQGKFFILSGNLLLRESTFCTVNCLKSFSFKMFFVYTLKLLRGPFRHICTKILLYFDKHMTCFRAS